MTTATPTRSFLRPLSVVAALGSVVLGIEITASRSAEALLAAEVNPIYRTNLDEFEGSLGPNEPLTNGGEPASMGFFFNTSIDNQVVNALGLPIFLDWSSRPAAASYDVILWSYDGVINAASDFNELARVTFNAVNAPDYVEQGAFYWQPIGPINLGLRTDLDPSKGFVVGAIGNFGDEGLPTLSEGSGTFITGFLFDGNGLNYYDSVEYGEMDVPLDYISVPPDANDPTSYYGFFNANVSLDSSGPEPVPGPLPLFGAAAALGWTRKLKRRISVSR